MQCACAILSSAACPGPQYFSTLSRKRHDFRGEKSYLTQNVGFDFLYIFCPKKNFILRRNEQDTIKNVYLSSCIESIILVRLWWKWNFLKQTFEKFNENPSSGSPVVPWGQEDQRTDKHDEANSCLSVILGKRLQTKRKCVEIEINARHILEEGWLSRPIKWPKKSSIEPKQNTGLIRRQKRKKNTALERDWTLATAVCGWTNIFSNSP